MQNASILYARTAITLRTLAKWHRLCKIANFWRDSGSFRAKTASNLPIVKNTAPFLEEKTLLRPDLTVFRNILPIFSLSEVELILPATSYQMHSFCKPESKQTYPAIPQTRVRCWLRQRGGIEKWRAIIERTTAARSPPTLELFGGVRTVHSQCTY